MSSAPFLLTPDFLHNTDKGSDKVYILVDLSGVPALAGKGITSWGRRGASLQHKILSSSETRSKRTEKLNEGYKTINADTVGQGAIEAVALRIQAELRGESGMSTAKVTVKDGGKIEVVLAPGQQRQARSKILKADGPVYDYWCYHAA